MIQTVNARDLHKALGVGKVFAAWFADRIRQYDFIENVDFVCSPDLGSKGRGGHKRNQFANWKRNRTQEYGFAENLDDTTFSVNSKKGRPAKEYAISIDMAKELCMVERNEIGKAARGNPTRGNVLGLGLVHFRMFTEKCSHVRATRTDQLVRTRCNADPQNLLGCQLEVECRDIVINYGAINVHVGKTRSVSAAQGAQGVASSNWLRSISWILTELGSAVISHYVCAAFTAI